MEKKIFQANGHEKKAGLAILISDKIDFKTKAITRDKEGHYIILNGLTQQEEITLCKHTGSGRSNACLSVVARVIMWV